MQKNFWKNLWKLYTPVHKTLASVFILLIIIQLLGLAAPYFLKIVIDSITNFNQEDLNKVIFFALGIFAVEQSSSLVRAYHDKIAIRAVIDIERYLFVKAQEKMVSLSLSYHEKENTGNKITKIQRGIGSILDLSYNFIWDIVPTIIINIATAIILFYIDYRFGLVFTIFVPIFVLVTQRYNLLVSPMRKKRYKGYEQAAGIMAQSVININTVKSFAKEKDEVATFKKFTNKIRDSEIKEFSYKIKFGLGKNLIVDLGKVMILLFGVYLILHDSISIGTFIFAYTITDKALLSLYGISRLYDRVMESAEGVVRLNTLLDQEVDIKSPKRGKKPKKLKGEVEFKNVEFAYDKSEKRALHDVSVMIEPGKLTALVGPSGGGKTTLARMVYRHYDPQDGVVLLDGINLKEYDLPCIRSLMALVPQEVELFNTTIQENIAYANPKASISLIRKAAIISNSAEFINTLDDGYKTMVGERGIKLSGGQRQRIGIARAILANPDILIFDEATSALDSVSEKLIQDSLSKISKNRTTIVIAHRLSTIQKADKIIVLERGKIAEVGTHAGLAKKKYGLYAKLHKLQKMGDIK